MSERLSVCYAAPGHVLLGTSGSTRNMLSLAKALGRWADVTVAFRNIREPIKTGDFKTIAIEPQMHSAAEPKDDVAARGLNAFTHISYLRKLHNFSRQWAGSYDLVFEKGWRLSGFLSSAFRRHGVPGVLVENDVRHWSEPIKSAGAIAKYGAHRAAQLLTGFYSRRIPLVIAETDELKAMLVAERGVAPECIEVVGLGVDHDLFRPLNQASCRSALGIQPGTFVLLYVGGMDTYHDVAPVIDALARVSLPSLELHLVGDGEFRSEYEARARHAHIPIRFHGQVAHDRVPEFIASADLCLAPYRVSAFPNESVSFSTLKIPEYMACERPVVSVPSGHIKQLIDDQISGFLFSNNVSSWMSFFKTLPSCEKLKEMGRAAARAVKSISWGKTAERYLEVCQELTTRPSISMKARIGFEPGYKG
ncbi:MAG TPA: glycosyltransferase family 4 protein [Candidatus Binatia bacterium]|nr:glycosyltransferase family 4 protein [Candidatus Binatia bacterium]